MFTDWEVDSYQIRIYRDDSPLFFAESPIGLNTQKFQVEFSGLDQIATPHKISAQFQVHRSRDSSMLSASLRTEEMNVSCEEAVASKRNVLCIDNCLQLNLDNTNECIEYKCIDDVCVALDIFEGDFCDDDDKCTVSERCTDGVCSGNDITCEEDTDLCTNAMCVEGTCELVPIVCADTGNQCTTSSCVDGVCTEQNTNNACDDGDACTTGDTCSSGTCTGTPITCQDTGNECTVSTCVDGTCQEQDSNEGGSCDDGDTCTSGDTCSSGVCEGLPVTCPDTESVCTISTCFDGTCQEQSTNEGENCDDGNSCTSGDVCSGGVCSGTQITCQDSGNECTAFTCIDGSCQEQNTNEGGSCDDGNSCTSGDTCSGGVCSGTEITCPDTGNVCTLSTCFEGSCQEQNTNEGGSCDDGNSCTSGDTCSAGVCSGTEINCPDTGNKCTVSTCLDGICQEKNANDGGSCDDGDSCTENDVCNAGTCSGTATICPDTGFICSTFVCVDGTCETQPANEGKECDGGTCKSGECHSGTPLPVCDISTNPCTKIIEQDGECVEIDLPPNTPCDDNNPCTDNDVCNSGSCSGIPKNCPDTDNKCTTATCIDGSCLEQNANEGGSCDDGDSCTDRDSCAAGVCSGTEITCPDTGNECTVSTCMDGSCQEQNANEHGICDDGDACTSTSTCITGNCVGEPIKCEDSRNECTTLSCVDGVCQEESANEGVPCDDGNACTKGEVCSSGICDGGEWMCGSQCNDEHTTKIFVSQHIWGKIFKNSKVPKSTGQLTLQTTVEGDLTYITFNIHSLHKDWKLASISIYVGTKMFKHGAGSLLKFPFVELTKNRQQYSRKLLISDREGYFKNSISRPVDPHRCNGQKRSDSVVVAVYMTVIARKGVASVGGWAYGDIGFYQHPVASTSNFNIPWFSSRAYALSYDVCCQSDKNGGKPRPCKCDRTLPKSAKITLAVETDNELVVTVDLPYFEGSLVYIDVAGGEDSVLQMLGIGDRDARVVLGQLGFQVVGKNWKQMWHHGAHCSWFTKSDEEISLVEGPWWSQQNIAGCWIRRIFRVALNDLKKWIKSGGIILRSETSGSSTGVSATVNLQVYYLTPNDINKEQSGFASNRLLVSGTAKIPAEQLLTRETQAEVIGYEPDSNSNLPLIFMIFGAILAVGFLAVGSASLWVYLRKPQQMAAVRTSYT